jgi:hypothetical protein
VQFQPQEVKSSIHSSTQKHTHQHSATATTLNNNFDLLLFDTHPSKPEKKESKTDVKQSHLFDFDFGLYPKQQPPSITQTPIPDRGSLK